MEKKYIEHLLKRIAEWNRDQVESIGFVSIGYLLIRRGIVEWLTSEKDTEGRLKVSKARINGTNYTLDDDRIHLVPALY